MEAFRTVRCETPGNFLVVPLHFFGFKNTSSRFYKRFRDGQYSLVSFLFAILLLTVLPCPAICKSEGKCPRALWSRRHCGLVVRNVEELPCAWKS